MPTTAEILGFTPAGPALTTAGILAVARKKPPIQPGDVFSKTPGEAASPVPAIAMPAAASTRVANPAAEADRKKSVLERVASTLAQIPSSIRQTGAKVFTPEAGTKSVLADVPVAGPVLETAAGLVVAPAQYAYEAIPHALAALAKPQGEREIALARALLPATARAMDEPTAENITAAVAEAVMLGAPFVKGLKGLGGKATPAETAPVPPSAFEPGAKLTIPIPGEAKVPVVAPEAPKSVYDYYNEPRKPKPAPTEPPLLAQNYLTERRKVARTKETVPPPPPEKPAPPSNEELLKIGESTNASFQKFQKGGEFTASNGAKFTEPDTYWFRDNLTGSNVTVTNLASLGEDLFNTRKDFAVKGSDLLTPEQMTKVKDWVAEQEKVRAETGFSGPSKAGVSAELERGLGAKPAEPVAPQARPTHKQAIATAQRLARERENQIFRETEAKFAEEAASTETIAEREARRKKAPAPTVPEAVKPAAPAAPSAKESPAPPLAPSPSKVRIHEELLGAAYGQKDLRLTARNAVGDIVGKLDYSEYQGKPHINFIEVPEQFRRQGIATQMMNKLADEYGRENIETGLSVTEAGVALQKKFAPVPQVPEAVKAAATPEVPTVIGKAKTFKIATFPGRHSEPPVFKDVSGQQVAPGLFIHKATEGVWKLTHEQSGLELPLEVQKKADVLAIGKTLGQKFDFTKPSSELPIDQIKAELKMPTPALPPTVKTPLEGNIPVSHLNAAVTADLKNAIALQKRQLERDFPEAHKQEIREKITNLEKRVALSELPPNIKTPLETMGGGGEMASRLIPEVPGKAVPSPTKTAEPIGRSDISRFLQEKLAVPVRTGRFRGKWGGIFKPGPKVVRSRIAGDLTTIAHEVGHFLDDKFGIRKLRPEGTKSWRVAKQNPIFKELDHLGDSERPDSYSSWKPYRGLDYKIGEGVAEFTRYYLHDPAKAQELAPNLYKQFSRILDANPEVKTALNQAQTDIKRYMEQPSVAKVLSQISISEREAGSTIGDKLQAFYTATIDALAPIKRAEKEMMGGKVPERVTESAYELGTLFLKGWMSKATSFIRRGAFNVNLETVGPGLEQILKPVGGQLDNLRVYMVSKRALELRARGKNPGISSVDARQAIKELETPEMAKAFEQIKAFQDNSVQYLVDSGILSEKVAKEMRKLNQEYVPFYRVFEQEVPAGVGGKRIANLWSPIKRIKGSGREIIDPLESIVKNVYAYVNLADRNRVAQAFVRNAERVGGAGRLIEQLPTPQHAVSFSLEEIRDALQKAGIEVMSGEMTDIASVFRPNAMAPKGENILTVFHGGDRTFYQVEPTLYRAFLALDNEGMNTLVKILSIPAKLLRAGATLTPEFVVRNPVRDQFTAFIQSKYGYVPGWDFVKGMYHAIAKTDTYLKFERSGALHSILVQMDRDYLQSTLRDIEGKRKLVKYFNPVAGLRILSEYGELGTRVGEFARGIKKEGPGLEGTLRAGRSAQELTVNFSRTGAKTQALNSLIAFWNATVQADVRAARAFKENPMRTSLKVAAGITTPSVLLYMVNRKNEAYKRLPQWQKDLFWMIPVGKETFIRIPKPFEMGILFGTVPERALQWLDQNDPEAFSGLANQILEGLLPSLIPTAVLPAVEGYANRSVFTGKPIVPKGMEGLSPELQARPTTSPTARAIGRAVGVSPLKIESGIRSTTGGLGTTTLRGLDLAGQALRLYSRQPTEPGTSLTRIPGVKGFIAKADVGSSDTMDRFYGDYTKGETLIADYRELLKRGEREKAIALRRSEDWRRLVTVGARGGFVGRLAGVARQLSELRQERTRLLNNKFIDEEARRRRLELNRRRTFTAVEGYQRRIGR